ncbi:MAG: hypothetical protein IH989_01770, partial [Planctomycetes bacterium]|nr:hypothetical protein [Planctomycetota bacterium]
MEAVLILKILNFIQAGFGWLAERGIQKERVQFLIDRAVNENRDVTTAEVQAELDATQKELDASAESIAGMGSG